jgi:hypothetical protein
VLKSKKATGPVLTFSHDEAQIIRKDISKYKLELEKIKDSLSKIKASKPKEEAGELTIIGKLLNKIR